MLNIPINLEIGKSTNFDSLYEVLVNQIQSKKMQQIHLKSLTLKNITIDKNQNINKIQNGTKRVKIKTVRKFPCHLNDG